jgi:hypothetical protein
MNWKIYLSSLIILIFLFFEANAQNRKIKTLTSIKQPVPLYAGVSLKATEYAGNPIMMVGGRAGAVVKDNLLVGINGDILLPTLDLTGIVENQLVTVYGLSGGIQVEPIINPEDKFHISFPVTVGGGWIAYFTQLDESGTVKDAVESDLQWIIEPGVSLETNLALNIRLGLSYSYRYAHKVNLPQGEPYYFNGHNLSLVAKIGKFYQKHPYRKNRYVKYKS